MLDVTDMGTTPLPASPLSLSQQRERLLMLVRGLGVKADLSLSRGGPKNLIVRQLVGKGVQQMAAQVSSLTDTQLPVLLSFCRLMLRDVEGSDCDDDTFIQDFYTAFDALEATFNASGADGGD